MLSLQEYPINTEYITGGHFLDQKNIILFQIVTQASDAHSKSCAFVLLLCLYLVPSSDDRLRMALINIQFCCMVAVNNMNIYEVVEPTTKAHDNDWVQKAEVPYENKMRQFDERFPLP